MIRSIIKLIRDNILRPFHGFILDEDFLFTVAFCKCFLKRKWLFVKIKAVLNTKRLDSHMLKTVMQYLSTPFKVVCTLYHNTHVLL